MASQWHKQRPCPSSDSSNQACTARRCTLCVLHPCPFPPPLTPCLCAQLSPQERGLYELVARHFLACCSDDARGDGTTVTIDMGGEEFSTSGLMITERNFLEVGCFGAACLLLQVGGAS